MFGGKKNECDKVRENLAPYLDNILDPVERDKIAFHTERCAECGYELDTIRATRNLLHAMPAAVPARSFTLSEAPARRSVLSFDFSAFSLEGSMRSAAAAAVILFTLVLSLDVTGSLSQLDSEPGEVVSAPVVTADTADTAVPQPVMTPNPNEQDNMGSGVDSHEATLPEGPHVDTNPRIAAQDVPDQTEGPSGNGIPVDTAVADRDGVSGVSSPAPRSSTPSWLLPLEMATGIFAVLLGSIAFVVWHRRQANRKARHMGV